MKLSEMRQVLSERGIQLTKSLGQNFLHDANQLRRIAASAELSRRDRVLEIGPGLGPLTELLLAGAGRVLAIEKDARLVLLLKERFATALGAAEDAPGALRLIETDALVHLQESRQDWREWKLVSNLPYSVASPILVELNAEGRGPARMVATLQLEVVRRLAAEPGDPGYGLLTLLLGADYDTVTWFKIPGSCFFPEPDVDSACIIMARRGQPLFPAEARPTFVRLVKRGFSQRRKMMFKLLREDWRQPDLERAFGAAGVPLTARAETVSPGQFAAMAAVLTPYGSRDTI